MALLTTTEPSGPEPSTTQSVLTAPGRLGTRSRALEPLRPGQALLRVTQCGVCASEVDQWLGRASRYPVEIGHEVAGVVEEVAEGGAADRAADRATALKPGDSVVSWVPGGGFTEYMPVEIRHALPVGARLAFPAVAEPLGCCVNAVERAAPRLGSRVAVIGTGFMSRLLVRLSLLKGARDVTVVGRDPEALAAFAAEGATRVVNAGDGLSAGAVTEVTGPEGADVTYEATGAQEGLALAGEITRTSGTVAVVGYHQGGTRSLDLGRWNERAFHIVNAHFRDLETILGGMRTAVALVESGRLDPSPLLTHRFPLEDAAEAMTTAAERPRGFVKAVVEPHAVRS